MEEVVVPGTLWVNSLEEEEDGGGRVGAVRGRSVLMCGLTQIDCIVLRFT